MVNYCCAINCGNSKTNRPDLKFFRFPFNNSERIWEWIVNLGRVDLLSKDMNELYTSYIVCAVHFERHYFLNEGRRKLVSNAVPTIFNHYSHDVDVSFILESLNRIQNEAAAVAECQEQIVEPAQCSQWSSKETTSLAASSQCSAPKSYKCQQCNEIFLSVHQLFSHELRDHEHVGTSQIGHSKKPLTKYNQHEKVFSPKNDVHQTKIHDTNSRTEASDTNSSQWQEEDLQTDASNMEIQTSSMGGKLHEQDGNQQTHTSNIEGKSQKQDENQQTHTSNMEGKSQKKDGNQQTHTSNMEGKSQKQDGNQQTHTSNMEEKSQKQDGNQQTHTSSMEGKSKKQDGSTKIHTSNMERKSQRQDGNEQKDTSSMGGIKSVQNAYLQREEPFISDNQHSKGELRYHDKETAFLQQGEGHFESSFSGEETASEVVDSAECEVMPLPYKCFTCEERFQTRCQLFYHDLEVHVGITKRATLQSRDISLKGSQKNLKAKITLNEGGVKRIAENTLEEQQPMKEGGVKRIAENILEEQQPMKEGGVKRIAENTLEEQQPMKERGVKRIAENTLEEQQPMKERGVKRIAENTLQEQQPMKEGGVKIIAENTLQEQQPMKVIIREKENAGEEVNEKHEKSESRQVLFKQAGAGNKPVQKYIVKRKIVQGDGKEIKLNSENLEQIKETIEAITAKYPWNKTLIDTGGGSEVYEQGANIQPKTFVIVKDDSQRGKGNQKTIGGYRIDVVTNYVLSQSQVKQLLQQ